MRIIIYHFPTRDWNLQNIWFCIVHCIRVLHFSSAFPFFVSFSGWNFRRNYLYLHLSFSSSAQQIATKVSMVFTQPVDQLPLLKAAFWRWFSLSAGGICDSSLEGIIFLSTWGCLGKENSKDVPNFPTPPARPSWRFFFQLSRPQLSENSLLERNASGSLRVLRLKHGPKKWKAPWLVACGSNKLSVLI